VRGKFVINLILSQAKRLLSSPSCDEENQPRLERLGDRRRWRCGINGTGAIDQPQ
jgi:hypothetical protein